MIKRRAADRRPAAGARRFGQIAAAAGVGRGHQHEAAGIADMGVGAGDDDLARLDRLAQGFQNHARKLGEFVHEQNAVMRQADFPGLCPAPAADDGGHRCSVMGFAKGTGAIDSAFVQQPA